MKCPECGKANRDGAEFCGFCGHALTGKEPAVAPRRRRWPWVVGPLLVIAVGAGGVFAGMTLFSEDDDTLTPTTVDLGDDPSEAISANVTEDTTANPEQELLLPPSAPFPTEVETLLVNPLIVDYDGLDEYLEMDPEEGGDGWIPAEGATPEPGRSQITLDGGGTIWRSPGFDAGHAAVFSFALEDDGYAGIFIEQGTAGFDDWRRWEVMVQRSGTRVEVSDGSGTFADHLFPAAPTIDDGVEFSVLVGLDTEGTFMAALWPTAAPEEMQVVAPRPLNAEWGPLQPYWTPGVALVDGTIALTSYYQFSFEGFANL